MTSSFRAGAHLGIWNYSSGAGGKRQAKAKQEARAEAWTRKVHQIPDMPTASTSQGELGEGGNSVGLC